MYSDESVEEAFESFAEWAEAYQIIEAYKFTYVPVFYRAFDMVVWQNQRANLQAAMRLQPSQHYHGNEEPALSRQLARSLDDIVWQELQEIFWRCGFWSDGPWNSRRIGRDGADWSFSGWRNGVYKYRAAWSPDKSEPASILGWFFFNLVPSSFCLVMTSSQAQETKWFLQMPSDSPAIIVSE